MSNLKFTCKLLTKMVLNVMKKGLKINVKLHLLLISITARKKAVPFRKRRKLQKAIFTYSRKLSTVSLLLIIICINSTSFRSLTARNSTLPSQFTFRRKEVDIRKNPQAFKIQGRHRLSEICCTNISFNFNNGGRDKILCSRYAKAQKKK